MCRKKKTTKKTPREAYNDRLRKAPQTGFTPDGDTYTRKWVRGRPRLYINGVDTLADTY